MRTLGTAIINDLDDKVFRVDDEAKPTNLKDEHGFTTGEHGR